MKTSGDKNVKFILIFQDISIYQVVEISTSNQRQDR